MLLRVSGVKAFGVALAWASQGYHDIVKSAPTAFTGNTPEQASIPFRSYRNIKIHQTPK
jgi:hypothetical protein